MRGLGEGGLAVRLVEADSTFEASVGNWVIATGTSFVRSTAQFHSGAASGLLTCTAVALCRAQIRPTTLYHVGEDGTIILGGWARAGTTGRTVAIGLDYFDAAGNLTVGPSLSFTDSTTWTAFTTTRFTVPAGIVTVAPWVTVANPAAAELHYFDDLIVYSLTAGFLPATPFPATVARMALDSLVATPGVVGHDNDRDTDDSAMQVKERKQGRKMSVDILPGGAYILGTSQPNEGMYFAYNSSRVNVDLDESDAIYPRWDAICATILNSRVSAILNTSLSVQEFGAEGGVGSWTAFGGTTLTAGTIHSFQGAAAFKLALATAASQGMQTAQGLSGKPCAAGSLLTLSGWCRADDGAIGKGRRVVLGIDFWDSGGTYYDHMDADSVRADDKWREFIETDVVVPVTGFCALNVTVLGGKSGETIRCDNMEIDTSGVGEDKVIFQPILGVPAASPAIPAVPPSSLRLGNVYVKPGVKAIHQSDIYDTRPYYTTQGQSFFAKDGTGRVIQGGFKRIRTDSTGHASLPYPRKFVHKILGVKVQPANFGVGQTIELHAYPVHSQSLAYMNLLFTQAQGSTRRALKNGQVDVWWQAYGV